FPAVTSDEAAEDVHADHVIFEETAPEILDLKRRFDGIHVAAHNASGEAGGKEYRLAIGRIDRIVDRVVRVGRRDFAGANALQVILIRTAESTRASNALEIEIVEIA